MAFPASEIIKRTSLILQDEDHTRWLEEELLLWITDGLNEMVVRKPSTGMRTATVELVAGTQQAIPDEAIQLLDIPRNILPNDKPGRTVRRTDRRLLDDQSPDWHSMKPVAQIRHFTYDTNQPKVFYVYPPAIAGTKVDQIYAARPANVVDVAQVIDLGEEMISALVGFVLYRAYSKDSEYANAAMATAHYQAFIDTLGSQTTGTPTTQAAAAAQAAQGAA